MPSGHKKKKTTKRKNKASASEPHQGLFRSHMQLIKEPSHGNGTIGKEKRNIPEKDGVGNVDREKGEENNFFEFKGGEASSGSEMDAFGNEGNGFSGIYTAGIPSKAENSQKIDVLKTSALDKSADERQETEKSELFESNGFSEDSVTSDAKVEKSELFESNGFSEDSVTSDAKVGWSGGLEETSREDKDAEGIDADNSLEEAIISPVKKYVSVTEEGEAEQAPAKKEEAVLAHEVDVSVREKEDKVAIDAHESMEAHQDNERDAFTPKIEIPHPPMVVRRASVWNCCGLLEVFMTSQQ